MPPADPADPADPASRADTLLAGFAADLADFETALSAVAGPDGSAAVEQQASALRQGYQVARRRRLRAQHPCVEP